MHYNYEIRSNGYEEILYLYLTMKYEFSKELTNSNDLGRRTKNFIQNNNIPFNGNKVYLIIDGIVVKILDLSKDNLYPSKSYFSDVFTINIVLEDNSICEITLREYLQSILLDNYNCEIEVLKAIAILFTTYALKMMREEKKLVYNKFITYKTLNYYQDKLINYKHLINKLNTIINSIDGLYLTYQNEYILPFIHYSNEGKTKTNSLYPYLSSVKSLWDLASPTYLEITNISYDEINNKLKVNINSTSKIEMYKKEDSLTIKLGNKVFNLEEIRQSFNLKSLEIYIISYPTYLKFITIGRGNSYGLSIYGSNEIAKNGGKYYDILKYYYPKTILSKNIKELS